MNIPEYADTLSLNNQKVLAEVQQKVTYLLYEINSLDTLQKSIIINGIKDFTPIKITKETDSNLDIYIRFTNTWDWLNNSRDCFVVHIMKHLKDLSFIPYMIKHKKGLIEPPQIKQMELTARPYSEVIYALNELYASGNKEKSDGILDYTSIDYDKEEQILSGEISETDKTTY